MTEYQLPRDESGAVDWRYVVEDIGDAYLLENNADYRQTIPMLKAIDANARKEERERCAVVAGLYPHRDPAEDGSGYWAANEIAEAIRALGDE